MSSGRFLKAGRTLEEVMVRSFRQVNTFVFALIALFSALQAVAVTVPVSGGNAASWSNGSAAVTPWGAGVGVPNGSPGVWNSQFQVAIPAGATNIAFTLNSFTPDDKGVVRLNGAIIGDGLWGYTTGQAGGVGTFDFGSGNAAYTYAGYTSGATTGLPNGTTNFALTIYVNDTDAGANPSAAPLASVNISTFNFDGTLTYDVPTTAPGPVGSTSIPTMSEWALIMLALVMGMYGVYRVRRLG